MELLRYQVFLGIGLVFLAIWWMLLKQGSAAIDTAPNPLVLYAPIWAVLALGIYAAGSVVSGVIGFGDAPEAAAEIDRQVLEAKAEMNQRGVLKDE